MKHLFFIIFLITGMHSYRAYSQGENNIWTFGDKIGLDFNSGSPTLISNSAFSFEGSAAVSNPEGKLLFYSGTYNVSFTVGHISFNALWDATHKMMPNGDSLLGNKLTSGTQGLNIVPFMDGSNKYYVFVLSCAEDMTYDKDHYMRYSVVDMDLRGGLGDIIPGFKNIIIDSFVSEKLNVTKGSGCDVWVINHRVDTNAFHAFKIDHSGLNLTPVVSGFPSDRFLEIPPSKYMAYQFGNMDISTDGKMIATSRYSIPTLIELYDFDNATGIVKNQKIIDSFFSYWVKFSPDGSKLYTSSPLAQYNLSLLPSLVDVKSSKYMLRDPSFPYKSVMKIGPDNKIYEQTLRADYERHIERIDYPNLLAPACGLVNIFTFPKSKDYESAGLGSPVFIPPASDTISRRKDTVICFSGSGTISADLGFNGYIWNDGSKGRFKTVSTQGKSWVKMRKGCTLHIDTFDVQFIDFKINATEKNTICGDSKLMLDATTPRATYLWQDGSTNATYEVSEKGDYTVAVKVGSCILKHTSQIEKDEFSISLGEDKMVCEGNLVHLNPNIPFATYTWNDGSTNSSFDVKQSGVYWVTVSREKCLASDTVNVKIFSCNKCIAIPNAFTPNNNGHNDLFGPLLECPILNYTLKIFNRYGQEVFTSTNPTEKWNGQFNRQELEVGVYYYLLKVQFDHPNSKEEIFKGDITLIR